jgi:hypothetical protein
MAGITSDVLKYTSIFFLKGTVSDFLLYSSKLLRFNDNSSSIRRYSLNFLLLAVYLLHIGNYDRLYFATLPFALRVLCLWKVNVT